MLNIINNGNGMYGVMSAMYLAISGMAETHRRRLAWRSLWHQLA